MTGTTGLAIQKFQAVERAQHRLERAEYELNRIVNQIPHEDMEEYVKTTEEITALQRKRCTVCQRAERMGTQLEALEGAQS